MPCALRDDPSDTTALYRLIRLYGRRIRKSREGVPLILKRVPEVRRQLQKKEEEESRYRTF